MKKASELVKKFKYNLKDTNVEESIDSRRLTDRACP